LHCAKLRGFCPVSSMFLWAQYALRSPWHYIALIWVGVWSMRSLGGLFFRPSLQLHPDFPQFSRPAHTSWGTDEIFSPTSAYHFIQLPFYRLGFSVIPSFCFRMRLRAMQKSRMRRVRLLRKLSNVPLTKSCLSAFKWKNWPCYVQKCVRQPC
jgi:hypothetical protein